MNGFVQVLTDSQRTRTDTAALERAWSDAFVAACTAWPDVEVLEAAVAAFVATRLPDDKEPLVGLAMLRVPELYLVCGCLRGQRDALAAFERTYGAELMAAARRGGAAQADEIVQHLRMRLLVGSEPRLSNYAGRGSLKRWLKVACTRLAIDTGRADRSRRARGEESGRMATELADADPELQLLKTKYRQAFKDAFAEAMQNLTPRARTMLRLHLLHGLTIDQIAPMHRVHRATAARWLARARAEVLERSRASLGELLNTDPRDVDSIMHLIASRLDVSIARHLDDIEP